jgi:hypothetical protein
MPLLQTPEILRLVDAAVDTGVALDRNTLIGALPRAYAAALQFGSNPRNQTLSDLNKMNQDMRIAGDVVPLLVWLEVAIGASQTLAGNEVFREVYTRLKADQLQAPAARTLPESREVIIDGDDRQSMDFFQRGVVTAASVIHLSVPVFANGVQQSDSHGNPSSAKGTGWMFGDRLVITNLHVIRARGTLTEPVADADLLRQVAELRATWDYDVEPVGPPAPPASCPSIVGLSLVSRDATLDYALLELPAGAPSRPGLPLRQVALQVVTGGERPALNIVQHGGGKAKSVAFRNNLATSADATALRYFTDTERGSSGSPVCDDSWRVAALHRSGGRPDPVANFQGRSAAAVNVGTPIPAILKHLADTGLLPALQARLTVV